MNWVWFVIQRAINRKGLCFFLILSSACVAKIIEAACRGATDNFCSRTFVAAWSSWKYPDRKCTFLAHNFSLYPPVSLDSVVTVFSQEFNLSRHRGCQVVQAKTSWAVNFASCYCSVLPKFFLLLSIFLFSVLDFIASDFTRHVSVSGVISRFLEVKIAQFKVVVTKRREQSGCCHFFYERGRQKQQNFL